jgi:NAD(P)H-flavin reductase/hemoglobin-like flavoprotein
MDEARLKESFAKIAAYGDEVASFFYSHLFLAHPQVRDMFPVSMSAQRDRLLAALGRIVADVGNVDELVPYLRDLGRDHRKFGATAGHYPAVGASLVASLAHFSGCEWTDELAADWTAAYTVIAQAMTEAAAEDEKHSPPWWDAVVVAHERRALDLAVLKMSVKPPLSYKPGQSVSIECPQRPRLWRQFSMANAPRPDATLDFHIRILDGGQVSSVLGRDPGIGTAVRLGLPVGQLTLDLASTRDIIMAAGGTGLAPLKAIIEHIAMRPQTPPRVHLVTGTRTVAEQYDLPDLEKLAARSPWLTVTPAVSHEPGYDGERGTVADVLARQQVQDRDAYVCGSSAMVAATVQRLAALGTPRDRIFTEDFGWSESR